MLKQLFFTLNVVVLSLAALPVQALTIVGKLAPNQRITLFFGGENMCRLVNKSMNDTIIIQNIPIKVTTEFRYGIVFKEGNKLRNIRHTMLLSPSDSLMVAKNGSELVLLNKNSSSVFLDKHIDAGFYALEKVLVPVLSNDSEFEQYLANQERKFRSDSLKIDSLYQLNLLDNESKKNWSTLRRLTYLTKIFKLREKNKNLSPIVYERLFNEALSYCGEQTINSDLLEILFTNLAQYWVSLQENIDKFKKPDFIDFYLENQDQIDVAYRRNAFIKYIRNVPDKTNAQYLQNVERIQRYAIVHDPILNDYNFNKTFFDSQNVFVHDKNGQTTSLTKILMTTGKKYVLIDMWASWCVPCRDQLPKFEKFKLEFAPEDVVFMSISIDQKFDDWVKALNEEGVANQPYQFRLKNPEQSALMRFFGIQTIPRYLILDIGGNVINDRFFLPTEAEFKPALTKIVKGIRTP